jgi:predicted O-methyltransferase YrrM
MAILPIEQWWDSFPWAKFDPGSWDRNLLLYDLASSMKAREVVYIGIGQQPNGVYLLGLHALQHGARVTFIDVAQSPINRATQIIEKFQLPVTILAYDSKAVYWTRSIDLLYIDGGHEEAQVTGDLENFAPKIRKGGLMILDDYGKKHLGVTEAVDRYLIKIGADPWDTWRLPHLWWFLCRRQ